MATVHQLCSEILNQVDNSKLDYKVNQTPYSLHISVRKKFSKISREVPSVPNSCPPPTPKFEDVNESLRKELLNTRNEYEKLLNFYLLEKNTRDNLEADLSALVEKVTVMEESEAETKSLNFENKCLKEKYETKCLEFKHLKTEIDDLNKDKNILSVALKSSKKEKQELNKEFDKKKVWYEKKILELTEFKSAKLAEEREVKIKIRKELKKSKQKAEKEAKKVE